MDLKYKELLQHHISTHTERSAEDRATVKSLETFLLSDGRINTAFSCDDKWPNHDGTFEFVPNPDISRRPGQNFIVQIKGIHNYSENDGVEVDNGNDIEQKILESEFNRIFDNTTFTIDFMITVKNNKVTEILLLS